MSAPRPCPKCGAPLPADAPQGVCPKCLLELGFGGHSPPAGPLGETTAHSPGFVPPDPAELAARFPQLEVLELLGQGGMGAVYKARQTRLDRLVALKVLPPQAAADPAFAERFAREARALARLGHPHIVAVHGFGEADGLYYFVMEFVDGANLWELIRTGSLTPEQALAIVPQICEALQFAHDEGVVHRDIKPENVLVDRRGRVKIADFGLAKAERRNSLYKFILVIWAERAMTCACKMRKLRHGELGRVAQPFGFRPHRSVSAAFPHTAPPEGYPRPDSSARLG